MEKDNKLIKDKKGVFLMALAGSLILAMVLGALFVPEVREAMLRSMRLVA